MVGKPVKPKEQDHLSGPVLKTLITTIENALNLLLIFKRIFGPTIQ